MRDACETYWAGRGDVSNGYRDNALRGLELHLWPTLGTTPVGQITREMLLEPLRRMDAAGKHVYVRRVRVWAGQVFDWAVEHGHAATNPAAAIRPEKAFGRAPVESFAALELGQVPAFMARLALEGELQSVLACKLLALTWTRTQELRLMRWADLDGEVCKIDPALHIHGDRLDIPATHTKTLHTRSLPIIAPMRSWLSQFPLTITADGVKSAFRRARVKAGYPRARFHDLRHACAALLIQAGEDLYAVGEVLGHSNVQTTKRYAHLELKRKRAAMNKVGAALGDLPNFVAKIAATPSDAAKPIASSGCKHGG